MTESLPLAVLNALDRAAFTARLAGVFEHSSWVAERAWAARPFASVAAPPAAMVQAMRAGSEAEQTALLRAHPELAGREAKEGRLRAESKGEQASAGLDRLAPAEVERLAALNAAYRAKFGFPFMIAVRARTKDQIFAELARRLEREAPVEAIARIRLERMFAAAASAQAGARS